MNRIEMKRYYRPGMILPLAAAAIALSFTGCVKRELEIRPDEGYARSGAVTTVPGAPAICSTMRQGKWSKR